MKHCVFRDKDSVYYVDEEGRMVQDTWIYADAGKTAKDGFEEGWYYFGADGYMKTGWQDYKGDVYYLSPDSGVMRADCTIDGFRLDSSGKRVD